MRPEREVLKHEPDSTLVCGDGVSCWCSHASAIQPDLPAVRLFETCNEPEEGRLSRAAGSDDDHAFPGADVERDVMDATAAAIQLRDRRHTEKRQAHQVFRAAMIVA